MKKSFQAQYQDKFIFDEHLVYEKNGGSGCSKDRDYKKMIDEADFVIIHTAIRTNYGGIIRNLSKNHLSLGVRTTNKEVFKNKVKEGCLKFLVNKKNKAAA